MICSMVQGLLCDDTQKIKQDQTCHVTCDMLDLKIKAYMYK
jgi:hypothetical protein